MGQQYTRFEESVQSRPQQGRKAAGSAAPPLRGTTPGVTPRSPHRLIPRALALLALGAAICVGGFVLLTALAPRNPAILGIDAPRAGASLEVVWRLGGVTAVVVDPLDPPARFDNGVPAPRIAGARWRRGVVTAVEIVAAEESRGASCFAIEDLLGRDALAEALAFGEDPGRRAMLAAPRCPAVKRADILARTAERSESRGEEEAAAEAYASFDIDRAIARARLALEICPWSGYARAIAGSALLERGVRRYRTGDQNGAAADLDEALERLTDPDERARALLARGLVAKQRKEADLARRFFAAAAITAPFHPAAAAGRKEK
jgi:hypothetical protein